MSRRSGFQENLRSLQARDKAITRDKQLKLDSRVRGIVEGGGNPEEALIKQQRKEEIEKEKQ